MPPQDLERVEGIADGVRKVWCHTVFIVKCNGCAHVHRFTHTSKHTVHLKHELRRPPAQHAA